MIKKVPRARKPKKQRNQNPADGRCPVPTNICISKRPFVTQPAKIFEIPFEVIAEILSYFPTFPKSFTSELSRYTNDGEAGASAMYLERTDTLRVLSQTCQQWRSAFFPVLWSRLDISATRSDGKAWYKVFGETTLKKSRLIIENSGLAVYVRTFTVTISRFQPDNVLPALVQLMKQLPNLDTVLIYRVHTQQTTQLKTHFEGHIFPSVTTVNLPNEAHNILKSFPEARKLMLRYDSEGSQVVSAMAKVCRKVEEVEGILPSLNVMKRVPGSVPNLRSIKFASSTAPDVLKPLTYMNTINHITLITEVPHFSELSSSSAVDETFQKVFKMAKEIVGQSALKSGDRKTVTVKYSPRGWGVDKEEPWVHTFDLS